MITRRRRQGSESERGPLLSSIYSQSNTAATGFQWNVSNAATAAPPFFFVSPATPVVYSQAEPQGIRQEDNSYKESTFSSDLKEMMASSLLPAATTSRDRTGEFMSAVKSLQSRQMNGFGAPLRDLRNRDSRDLDQKRQAHMEFMRIAKIIGKDLSSTYSKLEKLTLLAKKKSIFDDRSQEIQELTYIIRQDITNLNKQIAELQELAKFQNKQQSNNSKAHSTNVVVALQSKLASMSTEFKQVLEIRTENLKAQRNRREQFTGATPVASGLPAAALAGGPYGAAAGSVLLQDEMQAQAGQSVSIDLGEPFSDGVRHRQQQLQLSDVSEEYYQSRAETVQNIESTVVELGGIFQQLALMVREQEEMVQRIDANVEDAHMNIDAAHDELLRYFRSVTSNRWLMMKVFGVVIVFIIIFAVFFA